MKYVKTIILILFAVLLNLNLIYAEDWQNLILNWPVTDPDAISVWQTPTGELSQIIVKGDTYWLREDVSNLDWTSSPIDKDPNNVGVLFPTSIDSFTTFYSNGELWQTITKDNRWFSHKSDEPWTSSGLIFENEISTCSSELFHDYVDTMTVFPYGSGTGMTVTRGGTFWFKEDTTSTEWSVCGEPINNPPVPSKFDGHAAFIFENKLAELFVNDGEYWFFPDVGNRNLFFIGDINHQNINVEIYPDNTITQISPFIFGANLVWHEPHNQFHNSENKQKISNVINDVGIKTLRFPGGCGGDAYNWQDISDPKYVLGSTIDDYIEILDLTGAESFYTLNIEASGSNSHVNLNCHNLIDHPGTLQEAEQLISYFQSQGYSINHVEISNEPWAGGIGLSNWEESWESGEYTNTVEEYVLALRELNPNIKFTVATGNKVSWEDAIKNSGVNSDIFAFQYHPYHFGDEYKDNPLNQAKLTETLLKNAKTRHNKKLAVTEYNLYCWTGFEMLNGEEYYDINPYTYSIAQGLYLAEMFKTFIDTNVEYAFIWHLFESEESDWRCGIVYKNENGEYQLSPAAEVFKLFSHNTKSNVVGNSFSYDNIKVLSTKDAYYINTIVINPTPNTYHVEYNPGISTSTKVTIETIYGNSLHDTQPTIKFSEVTSTSGEFNLDIFPFSISSINYVISNPIKEDLNDDGQVNMQDLLILISDYGVINSEYDLTNDNKVGLLDIVLLAKIMI